MNRDRCEHIEAHCDFEPLKVDNRPIVNQRGVCRDCGVAMSRQIDVTAWDVPPELQGLPVEVSYSRGADYYGNFWERTLDRTSQTVTFRVLFNNKESDQTFEWEPAKRQPPIAKGFEVTRLTCLDLLTNVRTKFLGYANMDLDYAQRASVHEALKNVEAALKEFGWEPPPVEPTTISASKVSAFLRTGKLKK